MKKLNVSEAAALLGDGGVVAIPTETVYGLAADATSDDAVSKIFDAKGRPSDNPLIVHVGDVSQVDGLVSCVSDGARRLMDAFWPGPLTIVLANPIGISSLVTAGLDTVGVRQPAHPRALDILRKVCLPIAAPSANLSGKPSPTEARHVVDDLDGRIDGVVDGGSCDVGLESTVIDMSGAVPVLLRMGSVTRDEIEAVIGEVVDGTGSGAKERDVDFAPKAPGMKYAHYAPDAPVYIVDGSPEFLQSTVRSSRNVSRKVGVLATDKNKHLYEADVVLGAGSRDLYKCLREFDDYGVDVIFCECFDDEGLGAVVMNRLFKASEERVIYEFEVEDSGC